MTNSLYLMQIIGFLFACAAGVFLHFLYSITDKSILVAPFSAVNESIWEHMKLLFFPMFIYSIAEYLFIGENFENFWCVKLLGTLAGTLLIPVLYYTITKVFPKSPDWVNILIFFICAFVGYIFETLLFINNIPKCKSPSRAVFFFLLISALFTVWTFMPPNLPIFKDNSKHEIRHLNRDGI